MGAREPYKSAESNLVIEPGSAGWRILDGGQVVASDIVTLFAAKRRCKQLERERRTNPRTLLTAALAVAEERLGTGGAQGASKRTFAVEWRRAVLALEGWATSRRVRVFTGYGKFRRVRAFTVFSADGIDQVAVCPNAGPGFAERVSYLYGTPFGTHANDSNWSIIRS